MPRPRFSFHFGFLNGATSLVALLLLGFGIGVLWVWVRLPDVSQLHDRFVVVTYHGQDNPPTVKLQKNRPAEWTSLGEISRVAQGAVIVSEDWAFFQHDGYDPNQIKEAFLKDMQTHKFTRGASTITQQVVRNVFLTKDKTIVRKLKELYLAVELDDEVSKRRILETYFNIAEWGEGLFGIRAAARKYFSKEPSELTAKEGAFLAMLLPSPIRYSQSFRSHALTEYARKTVDSILGKMVQAQYLTEDQLALERQTPLSFEAAGAIAPPEPSPDDSPDPDSAPAPDPQDPQEQSR